MKYRVIAILVVVFGLCSFVAGQERKFDVILTLDQISSRVDRAEAAAVARIVNRSTESLRTSTLPTLNVYFSACQPSYPTCLESSTYFASVEIPSKVLAENESHEFRVNLSRLNWVDFKYSRKESGIITTNLKGVPRDNIFLYADVRIPDGYEKGKDGRRIPKYRKHLSNVIVVTLN
ncbi:MAG: hypothetical protein DWQ47_00945 [Acidobacteria bacterium]|nr:MAG: hypothetical protein DWQ32_11405 [Acidobacteriota bacterium]REK04071.1 MAG: hypothetical protein DWQ38_00930 [Acidobacteriota bacterium]REK15233.1 MAG: hypothetical protein DWQ43_17095 [Acidobacteriota bacterium]REK46323.1 MAG: hypothetical protein DWQ47_00945 [Acidobacteriota bacterium]